jgi:hypothetical protein
MSIECGECERDLRAGHSLDCSRYKRQIPLPLYSVRISTVNPSHFFVEKYSVNTGYLGTIHAIQIPKPLDHTLETLER